VVGLACCGVLDTSDRLPIGSQVACREVWSAKHSMSVPGLLWGGVPGARF
jgi:hypothetical protein